MELILQTDLPHQQKAVDAVSAIFQDISIQHPAQSYENPLVNLRDVRLKYNIQDVQKQSEINNRKLPVIGECLFLDIKMETGTGKTYVYTKIMFELHKRYGINKFIIAVPSLAIKAGTAQFIADGYTMRHFKDTCGYDSEIELCVLEAPKAKKKGRSYFPGVVSDFVKGSCQNTHKIYVLLVNMQLLAVRSNGLLSRDDYDYGVEGFYCPFKALEATRPFVFIDEPHRFSRDQKAYQIIMEQLKPQCLIRFGATFPEISIGKGRHKITSKDYQNLLYDLNACQSFNQGLIKGVTKEHFEPVSKLEEKVKIVSARRGEEVSFQHTRKNEPPRTFQLKKGDSLSVIHDAFNGITITDIGTNAVEFSNGLTKSTGEVLDVDIYMTSYQEQMIKLALLRHFETERANFCDKQFKIKTLALFFIDDIASYRENGDGKAPYLRICFERLLKETIEEILPVLQTGESGYKEYLEASLADLRACHAGYFSQDNSDSDEEIAKEVNAILHGKKELLQFRKNDGSYNTLRFLFSKWTLKEGWDNPNVFTIAKLRSSGSENSKLQEVGRGLRLPVDENGNRVANDDFSLNYIVDFTEADFADKLVAQINAEVPAAVILNDRKLNEVALKLDMDSDDLFGILLSKHYIDRHFNIIQENRDAFLNEYPDFASGVNSGKVKNRNMAQPRQIKIRKAVFSELKELWMAINQRYLISYDRDLDENMENVLLSILETPNFFSDVAISSIRAKVRSDGTEMTAVEETGTQAVLSRPLPYRDFLRRITKAVNIPVITVHKALCSYSKKHGPVDNRYINEQTMANLCAKFQEWKAANLQGRFHYSRCDVPVAATALTNSDGSVKTDIAQGRIGTRLVPGTPCEKYLYDEYTYDSPLEKENLMAGINEIVVFGKIPRNSIAIPTTTGGTFSPDFMYVVKKANGEKQLNVVVETKDVPNEQALRDVEKEKISCAEVFFATLSRNGYPVHFESQLQNRKLLQIIKDVFKKEEQESL